MGTHRTRRWLAPRRGTVRRSLLVVAALALVGCGAGDVGTSATTSSVGPDSNAAGADPAIAAFCERWEAARISGDLDGLESMDADVPAGLGPSEPAGPLGMGEIDVACHPTTGTPAAVAADRRIAPPLAATPAGLTVCSAGPTIGAESDANDAGAAVLYGDGAAADPYDGPMLGLLSVRGTSGFGGDGPRTPVVVRGNDGVAGPMTVFQQVVVPELGTQVEWHEGDRSIVLIGRGWSQERLPELLALAESVEVVDGVARFPEGARPPGVVEVFAGGVDDLALAVDPTTDYDVRYRKGDAAPESVTLSGFVASDEEFEAFQFLTLDLERTTSGDRTTIAGNAWFEASGPAVVTWREPDGSVVRVVDLSADPASARAVADASRDLTASEWGELVARDGTCPPFVPPPLDTAPDVVEPPFVPSSPGGPGR